MNPGIGAHLRANGIRQHYLHFPGPGPDVLIIPGIVSPAALWQHVGNWLSNRYNCYIIDVRGRGLSESGPHIDYGVNACAQDVIAFVSAGALNHPIIIGHSMGARIALRAAALAGKPIGPIVLVDPPTSGPGRRPYPIPKARTVALLRAAHRGEALQAMQQSTAAPWPEALQRLRAEWLCTCDERAVHVTYDDFHQEDMFTDLARAQAPIALLCAGEGGVVSDTDIAEMLKLRPGMETKRVPGVGHQLQAEDFEAFKHALDGILATTIQR